MDDKACLTGREKACILYGYIRRMAEESKEQGLFKDLSLADVMSIMIEAAQK